MFGFVVLGLLLIPMYYIPSNQIFSSSNRLEDAIDAFHQIANNKWVLLATIGTENSLVLCYVMLCYVMLCYVMLCYVMLCYVMLCYVMLCYVMLCYVMLCYVMLCYVMLCYVIIFLLTLHFIISCLYIFVIQDLKKNTFDTQDKQYIKNTAQIFHISF